MTQSSTPNDLVKKLYEPKISLDNSLNSEEQLEFVSLEKLKLQLDQAYLEPSESTIQKILNYAKRGEQ
jgi:hypothetical protein